MVAPTSREFQGKLPTSPHFQYKEEGKSVEIRSTDSLLLILHENQP
jgi:hypothetical protein